MKKLLLLLAILPFIISCQKNDFDLDKVSFPINSDSLIAKYKIKEDKAFSDMVRYYSADKNLMVFNDYNFSGSLDASSNLFENKISFYKENKTNKIDAYEIQITTTDEAKDFEDLLTKLGKTDFYYKNIDFSF